MGNRSYTYKKNRKLLRDRTQQIGDTCRTCGGEFMWNVIWHHPKAFTAGHIIDRARGGTDEIENLQPQHWSCNASAGAYLGLAIAAEQRRPSNVGRPRPDTPTTDPKSQEWP